MKLICIFAGPWRWPSLAPAPLTSISNFQFKLEWMKNAWKAPKCPVNFTYWTLIASVVWGITYVHVERNYRLTHFNPEVALMMSAWNALKSGAFRPFSCQMIAVDSKLQIQDEGWKRLSSIRWKGFGSQNAKWTANFGEFERFSFASFPKQHESKGEKDMKREARMTLVIPLHIFPHISETVKSQNLKLAVHIGTFRMQSIDTISGLLLHGEGDV